MKKGLPLLFFIFFSAIYFSNAQDTIITRNSRIISKVTEIGLDEIRYKDFENLDGPTIVIRKDDVLEIVYMNGKRDIFKNEYSVSNNLIEIRKKKHVIKFELFSPLSNKIAFGYENILKVGINLEYKVAYICPITEHYYGQLSGYFVKGGVKFLTSPTYYIRGTEYSSGLHGAYIKPEIIFSNFTIDGTNYSNGAIDIVFGKQTIIGSSMTIDYYLGLGMGFQTSDNSSLNNSDNFYRSYAFSHMYLGSNFPLVLSAGLTIGVPF